MNKNHLNLSILKSKLTSAFIEFFVITLIVLIPVLSIYIDLVVLKNEVGETSVTEITQESFLLITAIIYWIGAYRKVESRGSFVLIAGFFTALFIREMDAFLDLISHGFWFYIAITISFLSICYAYFFAKGTVLKPLFDFFETKTYFFLLVGIIILLIFSRSFGSGNLLWSHLLEAGHLFIVKTVVQEGMELLGYSFIFYGSLLFLKKDYKL